MLSGPAFNALLKTLEEPPPHVKFIFATTEAQKVPATIISRCQRFEFRPIPDAQIAEKLGQIAKAEGISVTPAALQSIARLAQGGMRDAQSILDQLISFCGQKISDDDVLDVYGLASAEQVRALARALAAGEYAALVSEVDKLAADGRDLNRVLNDLEADLREALLEAVRGKGASDRLGVSARGDSLLRILETLHAGEESVRTGLNERVNFEVLLLRAAEHGRTRAIDSLLQDLTELSAGLPQEAGQKKISVPPAPAKPAMAKPAPVADYANGHVVEEAPPAAVPASARSAPANSPAQPASSPEAQAAYQRLPAAARQLLETELRATVRGLRQPSFRLPLERM